MKFLTQVLCMLLSVLVVTDATRLGSSVYGLSSGGSARVCSRTTPCKWAVCEWRQSVRVDEECEFLEFPCQCRPGTTCQQSNIIKPGPSDYFTYSYYCLPSRTGSQS